MDFIIGLFGSKDEAEEEARLSKESKGIHGRVSYKSKTAELAATNSQSTATNLAGYGQTSRNGKLTVSFDTSTIAGILSSSKSSAGSGSSVPASSAAAAAASATASSSAAPPTAGRKRPRVAIESNTSSNKGDIDSGGKGELQALGDFIRLDELDSRKEDAREDDAPAHKKARSEEPTDYFARHERKPAIRCYNCDEPGHIFRDCPHGRIPDPCAICGGSGHRASNCFREKKVAREAKRYESRKGGTFAHVGYGIDTCTSSVSTVHAEERCALCGSMRHDTFTCQHSAASKHSTCVETMMPSGAPRFLISPDALNIATKGI